MGIITSPPILHIITSHYYFKTYTSHYYFTTLPPSFFNPPHCTYSTSYCCPNCRTTFHIPTSTALQPIFPQPPHCHPHSSTHHTAHIQLPIVVPTAALLS